MTSIPDLVKYIRFQLSELRARNEHHAFEDLARQFSRLRICERVLPATGPVGKGGDQGRDFETYRTYLQSTPIATSTFLGIGSDTQIVFACSLQQENIASKIRSDVKTICKSEFRPDSIIYFCETNVAVSVRHELQAWCKEEFQVDFELFDGQGLAENLANADVFWIAQEFLGVPAEMYPKTDADPDWYRDQKERWLGGGRKPQNFADFMEIKRCVRRATFSEAAKADLRDWISCMRRFLDEGIASELRRKAIYEICVASLRGMNNLSAERELLQEYFAGLPALELPTNIDDAVTLASYCSSAYLQGHLDIDVKQLHEWSQQLMQTIEQKLAQDLSSSSECEYLVTAGRIGFLQFRDGLEPTIRVDDIFSYWNRLLDLVQDSPLFPLETFSDLLVAMTPFIGHDQRFINLASEIDECLAKRSGAYVAAEKCRDRAVAYYEQGRVLLAIQQLHESKIRWFSAETMRGSLLSMLFLSHCYESLGLYQAAKYYAAGAMHMAIRVDDSELRDVVVKGAMQFFDCCYSSGEWLNGLSVVWLSIAAQNAYVSDPQEIQEHEDMQRLLFHAVVSRVFADRLLPEVSKIVEDMIHNWPLDDLNQTMFDELSFDDSTWLRTEEGNALVDKAIAEMGCVPFTDLGRPRRIVWQALGIKWVIESDSEYTTVLNAEEFASTLQIVIADLAAYDLCLVPVTAKISYELSESIDEFKIDAIPDNEAVSCRVKIPKKWVSKTDDNDDDDVRSAVFATAVAVLHGCSLLPFKEFSHILEGAMERGLSAKAFSVRSYSELVSEILPSDVFNASTRSASTPLADPVHLDTQCHQDLKWKDGPGPGYSLEKSHEFIGNRYRRAVKPIRLSLRRWNTDENFQEIVRSLRGEGYKDWRILLLLANHATNYRADILIGPYAPPDERGKLLIELMDREETDDDVPIPVALFSKEAFELAKKTTVVSIARTWGLDVKQQTPDFDAIGQLLDERYGNRNDDIEHDEIFDGTSE